MAAQKTQFCVRNPLENASKAVSVCPEATEENDQAGFWLFYGMYTFDCSAFGRSRLYRVGRLPREVGTFLGSDRISCLEEGDVPVCMRSLWQFTADPFTSANSKTGQLQARVL